jgi:hypothetical protein
MLIPALRAILLDNTFPLDDHVEFGLIVCGSNAIENKKTVEVLETTQQLFIHVQHSLASLQVAPLTTKFPFELLEKIKFGLTDDLAEIGIVAWENFEDLTLRREFLVSSVLYKTRRSNIFLWRKRHRFRKNQIFHMRSMFDFMY